MAKNLASKFEKHLVKRFSRSSVTDAWAGKDYKLTGVESITVLTTEPAPLTTYNRAGTTNRFGDLIEVSDTKQDMKMTKDECFQRTIDAGNQAQQMNMIGAAEFLRDQQDLVITPTLDKYRLSKWAAGAGTETAEVEAPNKDNILEQIFKGGMVLSNELVPKTGRGCFIKESIYLLTKLAPMINNLNGMGAKALKRGSVGMLDRMDIVPVPDSWMPPDVNFIIKAAHTTVDPVQLKMMRILDDQAEVDGQIVQGRIIYDSFVLETRAKGIYVSTYSAAP